MQLTSALTVIYVSLHLISIMFYDGDNSHLMFLFSIQSLYEQCGFCAAPTVLLSFYENKHRVLDCRHLLCAFIAVSRMLSFSLFPNLTNLPSE